VARPTVGQPAPRFRAPALLPDASVGEIDLADFLGRTVVLAFYPADDSPVCTRQLNAYTQGIDRFRELEAEVVALSPQTVESHRAFAAAQGGFAFPLVADADKAIARAYDVLGPLGFYRRSAFVIDGEGVLRFAHRSSAGLTFQGVDRLVAAVRAATP
jgi:thioredoxin-dependent peroxiredoxin